MRIFNDATENSVGVNATTQGEFIGVGYSFILPPTNGLIIQGSVGIGTFFPTQALTVTGNVSISGIATASQFSGSGLTLNNLNASNLASGTVPTGVISGSYTGITSVGVLSQLTVTGITTASQFSGSGLTLNNLNASNLASGTVPTGVISGSYTGITSVGVLSQLTVSGITTLGNIYHTSLFYDFYNSPGVAKNVLTSTGAGIAWSSYASVGVVTGSGAANQIAYWNNNNQIGGISTFVYSNGNVGIGSASPPNILTVSGGDATINNITVGLGSLQVSTNTVFGFQALSNLLGVTSFTNVAIGYQAGQFFNGQSNVILGYQAGQGSATTVPIVTLSTYVGAFAGQYTNGVSNAFIGYSANSGSASTWVNSVSSVVVGAQGAPFVNLTRSIALGNQVLGGGTATTVLTITDGIILGFQAGYFLNNINNVVIGSQALQGTATTPNTSNNSVVIGYSAGKYLNAANNVVVGVSALGGQVTGTNLAASNVAVGNFAAQYSQSTGNVIIGYQALNGSTTTFNSGASNCIIGFQAGQFVNSANNVAMGSKAIQGSATTFITGGNNVAIGYQAGLNFSTAFNNTLIGSATSALATGSYQIAIGYGVLPTGSNLGAFGGNLNASRTDLGIGTFTALSRLHLETLAAGNKGIYIAGFASQTANLLQIDATTSGANYVTVGAAGSVGIGTATPTQSLHILNSMRLSGGLYDTNNLPGVQIGIVSQVLMSNGSFTTWAPVKRALVIPLMTAFTPTGSGIDAGTYIIPQDPGDGTSTMNFTFKRVNVRVETPSAGISTINVVKYTGVGSSLGAQTSIISSNILINGLSSFEGNSTTFATGFSTCASGDKLYVNFVGLSATHQNFSVEIIARET